MLIAVVAVFLCSAELLQGDVLYFTQFQSHQIIAFDTATSKVTATLAIEDSTGIAGIAPSRDGARLYVVDGDSRHRLREFDTANWKVVREEPIENRLLIFGSRNPISISGDGQMVRVFTVNTKARTPEEIRQYNTRTHRWASGAIRVPCGNPAVAIGANGSWLLACPSQVLMPPTAKLTTSIKQPADAAICAGAGYVLAQAEDGQPWFLEQVTPRASKVDLRTMGMQPEQRWPVSMACAPSAAKVAVANGKQVWIIVTPPGKDVRRFSLGAEAAYGLAYSKDGKSIFSVRRESQGGRIVLTRIDTSSGSVTEATILKSTGSTPFSWQAGPAR